MRSLMSFNATETKELRKEGRAFGRSKCNWMQEKCTSSAPAWAEHSPPLSWACCAVCLSIDWRRETLSDYYLTLETVATWGSSSLVASYLFLSVPPVLLCYPVISNTREQIFHRTIETFLVPWWDPIANPGISAKMFNTTWQKGRPW